MTTKTVKEFEYDEETDYETVFEALKDTGFLGDHYEPEYSEYYLMYSIFEDSQGCYNSYILFWDRGDIIEYNHNTDPLGGSVFKDFASANFFLGKVKERYPKSNITKVKYLLEKYYILTYSQHSVHVQIVWGNEKTGENENQAIDTHVLRFKAETQKDEFIDKLREIRVNVLNNLHEQLLRVTETRKYEEL